MRGKEVALAFSIGTLCTGVIIAGMLNSQNSSERARAEEIQRQAEESPPLCSSLQGEDWRVISLGKNTFLIADVVKPTGFLIHHPSLLESRSRAERAGLETVLQRFEGTVLSVVPDQGGFRHIVTVTDDRC